MRQIRTNTDYERRFLDEVLGVLPELADWSLSSQDEITVNGTTYRPDFTLIDGPDRIAIEIDGKNKGKNKPTHDEWTFRQTALVSEGWMVLRFTNRQVRDEQEYCRRQVAVCVARIRERRLRAHPIPPTPGVPTTAISAPTGDDDIRQRRLLPVLLATGAAAVLLLGIWGWTGRGDDAAVGAATPTNAISAPTSKVKPGVSPISEFGCPGAAPVKGNLNDTEGTRLYQIPEWQPFYDNTKPEKCFANIASAEAAGYRKPGPAPNPTGSW